MKTLLIRASFAATLIGLAVASQFPAWWITPTQQTARLLTQKQYQQAAKIAVNPDQQGAALYRAAKFNEAGSAFARDPSAAGAYNRGNALVMQGKYDDAIKSYDRALQLQPAWRAAEENRSLAKVRRDRLKMEGGDQSGGQVEADEIVFEKGKAKSGEPVEVNTGEAVSDSQLQAMWLRRVQTKPADFLRAKFAYQLSAEENK